MNIGTRCSSLDAFVATYSRYVIGESLFVVSREPRPLGVTSPFVFRLADGSPVLCGVCLITQLWTDDKNPYKRPGIWLSICRLNADSFPVLMRMQDAQNAASRAGLIADVTARIALEAKLAKDWDLETEARPPAMLTDVMAQIVRTQGGVEILPANPLSHIDDEALEDMLGFALTVQPGPFEPSSDDQLFEDTPLPHVLTPTPAAAPAAAAATASPSIPPRPATAPKPPKMQIPAIRPMATPPIGMPVVPGRGPLPGSPSVGLPGLPPLVPPPPGRDHGTEEMPPLVAESASEPTAATSSRAPRDTIAGADPATDSTDSTLPATSGTTARRAARDTIGEADPATVSMLAASPSAAAPRTPRDTISGGDPSTEMAGVDSYGTADRSTGAPRTPRDTITGSDQPADMAAGVDSHGTADRATGAPRAPRDTINAADPPAATQSDPAADVMAVSGAEPVAGESTDEHAVRAVAEAMPPLVVENTAEPLATESSDTDAARAMATEAMPPLVVENTAEPLAAGSSDTDAERAMATEAMPPLTVAHPPEPSASQSPGAPTSKAGRAFATGAMRPLAVRAPGTEPSAARAYASESTPTLAAPTHPSSSAWTRLVSWSRQGPSRVVLAIAAIAIGVLMWKLLASDTRAPTLPPTSAAVQPAVRPSGATGSGASEAAGASMPPSANEPAASAAGSADTDDEAIEIDATNGSAAEAAVEPKGDADAKADARSGPHTVYISSYPQGAEVYLAGRRLGMTPFVTKMPGFQQVKLTVEKKGFQTIVRKFKSTDPKTGLRFKLVKSCTGLACM